MIRDLSFRYRVPLNLSLVVLATGLCLAGIVLWHDYRAVRDDAAQSAAQLGRLLAHALSHELAVGDTWQAYRTLKATFQGAAESWLLPAHALVLDGGGDIQLSSDPARFPLALPATGLGAHLGPILARSETLGEAGTTLKSAGMSYRLVPVRSGDIRLGTLVLAFPTQRLWPRFYHSGVQVLTATAAILFISLPLGWLLGRRVAQPLADLEACVARLGEDLEQPPACPATEVGNELGRLRARIEAVSAELRGKRALARQVIRSERQAALGRLAASVAHEINNPLGGMFTAIATFKRHGREPKVAEKTVSLLERGLDQIRHIVSALLVEVKVEPRNLVLQDIDDILDLVTPRARQKRARLDWSARLEGELELPAGPVRQVVLNLVLNAIQAIPDGGEINVEIGQDQGGLTMRVANDGEPIPEERVERLFEPFNESGWSGTGLGLWITDQIVRQLHGRIQVGSESEMTVFRVALPLAMERTERTAQV